MATSAHLHILTKIHSKATPGMRQRDLDHKDKQRGLEL